MQRSIQLHVLLMVALSAAFSSSQDSLASEVASLPGIQAQLKSATVRIYVRHEGVGQYGSGTIVDLHGSSALIATCGHLFDTAGSRGKIRVTTYDTQEQDLEGEVLAFDLKQDVALIRVQGIGNVTPIRLYEGTRIPEEGDSVFVAGCDFGNPPKTWTGNLTSINRAYGRPTIAVSAMPRHGRSGGALIDADGRLIGICNAQNPLHMEGVYAAVSSVRGQLRSIGDWRTAQVMSPQPPPGEADSAKVAAQTPAETRLPAMDSTDGPRGGDRSAKSSALLVTTAKPGTGYAPPARDTRLPGKKTR